jgi:type VI secretion system protein ImpF
MAHWSLKEQLQPSLLDRLTDDNPENSQEAASKQIIGEKQFKNAVIRDLGWLMNAVSMEVCESLDEYPEVKTSVLNYGMPDLTGKTSSNIDVRELESGLKDAILRYEPRIISKSLRVRVRTNYAAMSHNSVVFDIQGSVFGQPAPFQVILRSQLDLESGEFNVREHLR